MSIKISKTLLIPPLLCFHTYLLELLEWQGCSSVEDEEVTEVVLLLLVVEVASEFACEFTEFEAVKMLVFGIISSRLRPFVSGTKARENRKPKAEMMA